METHSFAVAQATRLLERLAFQINGVVHSPRPEAIHDLRVAIRRFAQALSACKGCFPRAGPQDPPPVEAGHDARRGSS